MKFFFTLLLSIILITSGQAQQQYSISAEAFGKLPEIKRAIISPNGDRILLMQNYKGKIILTTRSLVDLKARINGIPYSKGEFSWVKWVSNDHILAGINLPSKRNGVETTETRLIYLRWDGSNIENPIRLKNNSTPNTRSTGTLYPQIQDSVVDFLDDDPDNILIQLSLEEHLQPAVYKLNLKTKRRSKIVRQRATVQGWEADDNHDVRYGEGISRKASSTANHYAYYRKNKDDSWKELFKFDELTEERPFSFEGFSSDPDVIYISKLNNNSNKAYYRYNIDSKQVLDEIASNDNVDINNISIDEEGNVTGYSYFDEKPITVLVDQLGKTLTNIFDNNFPEEVVRIESLSEDKKKVVFKVSSPTNPGTFYLLDLNKPKIDIIGFNYKNVNIDKLSPVSPITYQARDGLKISGYLTLPLGANQKNLPTIIMPHGGPMARDVWGFDYWVQFLTTRGYAVLQMNYRGSTGYGLDFEKRGNQEWGRKMLEDINDGTKWIIEQGYSDPDKICIMGGSYGGYASLQAPIKNPSLYKCSVAFAPVADLRKFMSDQRNYFGYKIYENYVKSDEWTIAEASPIENIDTLNIPVFLAHGDIDRSVNVNQSQRFYKAMKKAGKEIIYHEYEDGDHFFSNEKDRIEFLSEVEKFLKNNLLE